MFRITPVQDKKTQQEYAAACGADFVHDAFAYAMLDNDSGALMGMSQFDIRGEWGYIYDLASVPSLSDFEAMFILGRQTMNFIDMCQAHMCRARAGIEDTSLLCAIGFHQDSDGEWICDMNGMFDGKCSSAKQ